MPRCRSNHSAHAHRSRHFLHFKRVRASKDAKNAPAANYAPVSLCLHHLTLHGYEFQQGADWSCHMLHAARGACPRDSVPGAAADNPGAKSLPRRTLSRSIMSSVGWTRPIDCVARSALLLTRTEPSTAETALGSPTVRPGGEKVNDRDWVYQSLVAAQHLRLWSALRLIAHPSRTHQPLAAKYRGA